MNLIFIRDAKLCGVISGNDCHVVDGEVGGLGMA